MSGRWIPALLAITLIAGFGAWHVRAADPESRGAERATSRAAAGEAAEFDRGRAEEIYRAIRGEMVGGYAASGDPATLAYPEWTRFNKTVFRSAGHGERLVNTYANDIVRDIDAAADLAALPAGSVFVMDSFTVGDFASPIVGPLYLMEKMPVSDRAAHGAWRYMLVQPDGTIDGITGGLGAENVRACAECHAKAPTGQDSVYFVPEDVRAKLPPR